MRRVPQNVIKHKVGLLNLAAELGSVSRVGNAVGFSRDTFYYYQPAMAGGGVDALINAKRKQLNLRNRISADTETLGEAKVLIKQWHIHFSTMRSYQGLWASMI